MRAGARWGLGIGAVAVALFALGECSLPGAGLLAYWSIPLPSTRDPRLVGTWRGGWLYPGDERKRPLVTILRADGSGEWRLRSDSRQPFRWGTADGVLYTRRMAVDAWVGTRHPYVWEPDGRSARFGFRRAFDPLQGLMRRDEAGTKKPAGAGSS